MKKISLFKNDSFKLKLLIYILFDVIFIVDIIVQYKTKYEWLIYQDNIFQIRHMFYSLFFVLGVVPITLMFLLVRNNKKILKICVIIKIACICFLTLNYRKPTINYTIKIDNSYFMTYYYQGDDRWGNIKYGDNDIRRSGCGPTAIAMVHSYVNKDITPVEVAKFLQEHPSNDFYGFMEYSKANNWNSKFIHKNSIDVFVEDLKRNRIIISCISTGNGRHIICAYGIDEYNNVLIADPGDVTKKCIKLDKLLEILPQELQHPFISVKFD